MSEFLNLAISNLAVHEVKLKNIIFFNLSSKFFIITIKIISTKESYIQNFLQIFKLQCCKIRAGTKLN